MKKYSCKLNNLHLQITASHYTPGEIVITLTNNSKITHLNHIKRIFHENKLHVHTQDKETLICINSASFRKILDILIDKEWITIDEHANLAQINIEIQKIKNQRSKIAYTINKPQSESLITLAEPYIMDIIECINDPKYVASIFKFIVSAYNSTTANMVELKKFLKEKQISSSVLDSCGGLLRIYVGMANMEGHLLRMDPKVLPALELQIKIINDYLIYKFNEKFSSLNDENKFLLLLELEMFQSLSHKEIPLSNNLIKVIRKSLKKKQICFLSDQDTFACLTEYGNPILLPMISRCLETMGILKPNQKPDWSRLKSLQIVFESSLLSDYISELKTIYAQKNESKSNPLLQSLISNDVNSVEQALQEAADINQYFASGQTPLLYALENCNDKIVNTLLNYKPDLDKINLLKFFAPIYLALIRGNVTILNRILLMGANAFLESCIISISKTESDSSIKQPLTILPINFAITRYKNNKTENNLALMKKLLEFGAGMGMDLSGEISKHLDGMVIFNAFFDQIDGVDPVDSMLKILKIINQEHLRPRWCKIFQQAWGIFGNTENMKNTIWLMIKLTRRLDDPLPFSISPIYSSYKAHQKLKKEVTNILGEQIQHIFLDSINNRRYAQALRRACTAKPDDEQTRQLINALLKYQKALRFNINEQAGAENQSALHYAAIKGNLYVYYLLIQHGANEHLARKDGKTPRDLIADEIATTQPNRIARNTAK